MTKTELIKKGIKILKKKLKAGSNETYENLLIALEKKLAEQKTLDSGVVSVSNMDALTKAIKEQTQVLILSQNKEVVAHLGDKPAWYKEFELPENIEVEIKKPKWYKETEIPKEMTVHVEKPKWYEQFKMPEAIAIKNKHFDVTLNEKQHKENATILQTLLGTLFSSLVDFLSKLQKSTYKASLVPEHYVTPQSVVLLDPRTMKPLDPKEIGDRHPPMQGGNAGPASIYIRGSNGIGDGKTLMTTAGTRQQLPNQPCSRVRIQAHPDNTGDIVVGGSTVIAAVASRRGLALYSSQWAEFAVDNLNRLWIDSTVSGDKLNYIYEYTI